MAVTLTPAAAQHVQSALSKRGKGVGLRFGIKKSGCSGFAYKVDYVDEMNDGDLAFESHGVKVVVDQKSLPFVDGTEVDYAREGINAAFKFNNPKVKEQCGCGESFTVE